MRNQTDLVKYPHAEAFSPVKTTWINVIQKVYFQSWPVLTAYMVKQYLPNNEITAKAHIEQVRKNTRSTRPQKTEEGGYETIIDKREGKNISLASVEHTGTPRRVYTEQTGQLPIIPSSGGKKYLSCTNMIQIPPQWNI